MRQCAFCNSDASSGEHLWSDWIGRLFTSSGYNFRHVNTDGNLSQRWQAPSLSTKAKVICRECNNTWMSTIESDAKSALAEMIRLAAPVSLLASGINALSAYAFKCAVIANHMSPASDGNLFFSPYDRRRFRESRQIPDGVQMWIAAFSGVHATSGIFKSSYMTAKEPCKDIEFFTFTFGAGYLVFQVLASRWTNVHHGYKLLPHVEPDGYWNTAATQFWPRDGFPLQWPPTHILGDDMLAPFVQRFGESIKIKTYMQPC
jgi:hypothetical protein